MYNPDITPASKHCHLDSYKSFH